MREVIPQQLWIGNAMDACDLTRLHETGIRAIVDLAFEELPPRLTRDLIYCRFPLVDGGGNSIELLTAAICQTISLIQKQLPTLVACGAGISRSPSIAAAVLATLQSRSANECLREVLGDTAGDVSPLLWDDVKTACHKISG